MELGLDRCAKVAFKIGKLVEKTGTKLNLDTIIKEPEQYEVYKNLGVNEEHDIQHASMKETIPEECYSRV